MYVSGLTNTLYHDEYIPGMAGKVQPSKGQEMEWIKKLTALYILDTNSRPLIKATSK